MSKTKSNQTKKPVAPEKATGKAVKPVKRTPNGRTLKTKDEYLPQEKGKVKELKNKRWVAVIDSNQKNELAVVRLTDEEQKNTTELPTYKKGNKRKTHFKHFVETEDNEGKPIKATKNGKFQENSPAYDLSARELVKIKDKVLNHTKQSSENRKKIEKLHKKDKK